MDSSVINDKLALDLMPSSSKKSYKLQRDRVQDFINLKIMKIWVTTIQLR